jgi:uncharacterized protein YndB with AHSA1/START domain
MVVTGLKQPIPKEINTGFNGVIHEFTPNHKITRTFEFENTPFGVQLEVLEFEQLTDDTSKLTIHTIFESVEQRDQMLKMPFAQGIIWRITACRKF